MQKTSSQPNESTVMPVFAITCILLQWFTALRLPPISWSSQAVQLISRDQGPLVATDELYSLTAPGNGWQTKRRKPLQQDTSDRENWHYRTFVWLAASLLHIIRFRSKSDHGPHRWDSQG